MMKEKIENLNWQAIQEEMNEKGFALVPEFLSNGVCEQLIEGYNNTDAYRKTVVMERYRFGSGEYKYFDYPLPAILQTIRENLYPELAGIANTWMERLKLSHTFPYAHKELLKQCKDNDQLRATVLILKYGAGGYNTLHQDLYGKVYFPIQVVVFLNEPGVAYTGGEFVLVQQTPRAQSRAIVLNPGKGDMLVFTTNFRPLKGSKGYYRVNMKHGVSEIKSGERYTLGIIFHDALS